MTGNIRLGGQDDALLGEARTGDLPETTLDFTGQRRDGTGLLFYQARYYDPALGKFLSPDTLVPGAAVGAGGALGTIGVDEHTALAALTVGFHEPGFLAGLNAENAFLAQRGFFDRGRKASTGPGNPQALNRYAYVLNNPVRYTDPTGHTYLILFLIAEDEKDENGNTFFDQGYRGPAAKDWDWEHVLSGHSQSGERYIQSDKKTAWEGRSEDQIKASAQAAWKNRELVETQRDPATGEVRQRYRGVDPQTGETIEFWSNKSKRRVETAYPVPVKDPLPPNETT